LVNKGDTLLEIDSENASVTLQEVIVRKEVLLASKVRLDALINDTKIDFSAVEDEVQEQIIDDQLSMYNQELHTAATSRSIIVNQLSQTISQIREITVESTNLSNKLEILRREESLRSDLLERGLNSQIVVMELEKEIVDVDGRISQMVHQKEALRSRRSELQQTLAQLNAQFKSRYTTELADINSELLTIDNSLQFHSNTVDYQTILAPLDGFIHDLSIIKVGEIVAPGVTLMEIVPKDRDMIAEIRISSQDIGHVREGQEVTMKLTTYNFRRYGGITGDLQKISQSAYLNEQTGESYYRGIVHVDDTSLEEKNSEKVLLPGMTLTAEIKTGKKTLLEYLLKPIYMSAYEAFHER